MTDIMLPMAAPRPLDAPLAAHEFPAVAEAFSDPVVLLHGWGFDSQSWGDLLPSLRQHHHVIALDLPGFGDSPGGDDFSLGTVLEALAASLPPKAVVMGWSLGGMLAVALAARYPERVSRVITLASNLCFVASPEWPDAMAPAVNQRFTADFERSPARTLKRFAALVAHGDGKERTLCATLSRLIDAEPSLHWVQALGVLARLDNRQSFRQLQSPGLHLFGENDALVPAAVAAQLPAINPRQRVMLVANTGHAPHLSQPDKVAGAVQDFLRLTQGQRDKRRVAESFSRAAPAYDSVARLQRNVGEHLLNRLGGENLAPASHILDLGCGTGYFTEALHARLPEAQLLGLDIAEGMVRFARQERSAPTHWLCGDAEQLPLVSSSIDLVFSSLAVQWCEQLPALFDELYRALRPGGRMLIATLGPHTLWELKAAWQAVDGYEHVNRFPATDVVDQALQGAGFHDREWHSQEQVLRYRELAELMRELKVLGARNVNRGQSDGLTGRRKLRAFQEAYESHRCEGSLPATYEVLYLSASKPLSA